MIWFDLSHISTTWPSGLRRNVKAVVFGRGFESPCRQSFCRFLSTGFEIPYRPFFRSLLVQRRAESWSSSKNLASILPFYVPRATLWFLYIRMRVVTETSKIVIAVGMLWSAMSWIIMTSWVLLLPRILNINWARAMFEVSERVRSTTSYSAVLVYRVRDVDTATRKLLANYWNWKWSTWTSLPLLMKHPSSRQVEAVKCLGERHW